MSLSPFPDDDTRMSVETLENIKVLPRETFQLLAMSTTPSHIGLYKKIMLYCLLTCVNYYGTVLL